MACENGSLWFIDLKNGKLKQSDLKSASAWTAMTFTDDDKFLALADNAERIVVVDQDEKEQMISD